MKELVNDFGGSPVRSPRDVKKAAEKATEAVEAAIESKIEREREMAHDEDR